MTRPTTVDTIRHRALHAQLFGAAGLTLILIARPWWPENGTVHELVEWIGYAAVASCVLGRAWCGAYIAGRKKHELVARGPYSVVRNPLYLFSLCGVAGIGLLSGVLTIAALMVAGLWLYYLVLVRREEQALLARFGDAYDRYRTRTPAWLPHPTLWRDIDAVTIRPSVLARTLRDAALFFVAFPLLEAVDHLHVAGVLPNLLVLP